MSQQFSYLKVDVYQRPEGHKRERFAEFPYSAAFNVKAALIEELGLRFTFEDVGGNTVNLCLEDDEFDYKFELVSNTEAMPKLYELVTEFDVEDYSHFLEQQMQLEGNYGE